MALAPYDAVRESRRKLWRGLAAAVILFAGILWLSGIALRLIGGFFAQVRGLLRLLLF